MAVDAVIFDMDGTLVDNMRFHVQAWVAFCAKRGLDIDPEEFNRRTAGKKNDEIFPDLFRRALSRAELDAMAREKEETYRALYRPNLAPMPGLVELLERLKASRIHCLVASAAPKENRALVLDGLNLRRYFETVTGAEDAPRGKPEPDIFFAAAKSVSAAAERCVVFEDAVNGVLAAKAARMLAVGVETLTPEPLLRDAGAAFVVRRFDALPAELEARLFG